MEKFEELLQGALKIRQPSAKEGLRVNIDTILLSHFTRPKRGEKIMELGCAHGAIALILAKRGFNVTAIDIEPKLIELAKQNAAYNGLNVLFQAADLREYRQWAAQSFDRVVVNPPYYETRSGSQTSPSKARAAACQGTECSLCDVIAASRHLLKNRGKLDLVMTATRTAELFALLESSNLSVKAARFVYPKPQAEASVVLVEAVRSAKCGMKILPPLFVLDENGKETDEMLENYRL